MSRFVPRKATGPIEIKPSDKSCWVCNCGLTQDGVLCDGSHNLARKEAQGKVYVYDEQNNVVETRDEA